MSAMKITEKLNTYLIIYFYNLKYEILNENNGNIRGWKTKVTVSFLEMVI